MGKGNGKCFPSSIEQLFGINMAGMMESAPHLLYFHLLEHSNDGEYSPTVMFPSLPSICNDGEHFLLFLFSFLFEAFVMIESKVIIFITTFDLFPHPRITRFCIFSLIFSCIYLELFLRGQSMQVHDLAKDEWLLFTQKWVESAHGNSDL